MHIRILFNFIFYSLNGCFIIVLNFKPNLRFSFNKGLTQLLSFCFIILSNFLLSNTLCFNRP